MSLFFLIITIVTYCIGYLLANITKPVEQNKFQKQVHFQGSIEDFDKLITSKTTNHSKLKLVKKSDNYYLINEKAGLFSFGSYFHIHLNVSKLKIEIKIAHQPKLISSTSELKSISDHFDLDFEDVG